jgi:creatinine amidohydrolase
MDASELYDPEFRKLIKSKKSTIIIPIGSLEQHGAHLPITTDSDIVTEIASRLAKKCGFIVFPTVNYGISEEHDPLINVNITKKNLFQFLNDIIVSLVNKDEKFRLSYIILNGHHGNVGVLDEYKRGWDAPIQVRQDQRDLGGLKEVHHVPQPRNRKGQRYNPLGKLEVFHYWKFMNHEFDHAGFVETSIMLAISDKVKMEKAKKGLIIEKLSKLEQSAAHNLSTQPGGFSQVAKNGVWGDPTNATKKDGEKFLTEIIRNLAKECQS